MDNSYKQVIIDRFVDDCRCMTIKNRYNLEIERANIGEDILGIQYVNGKCDVFKEWDNIINFISNCTVSED